MGKRRFTEANWRKEPWFRGLCAALASCDGEEEVAEMLRDLGSLSELQAWSERLEVAKQLAQGMTYREVAKNTGASTTTVTRVAKYMENGEGGYKRYLMKFIHDQERPYDQVEDIKQEKAEGALRKYL